MVTWCEKLACLIRYCLIAPLSSHFKFSLLLFELRVYRLQHAVDRFQPLITSNCLLDYDTPVNHFDTTPTFRSDLLLQNWIERIFC